MLDKYGACICFFLFYAAWMCMSVCCLCAFVCNVMVICCFYDLQEVKFELVFKLEM